MVLARSDMGWLSVEGDTVALSLPSCLIFQTRPTGNFSGTKKTEEIMVARGSMLELLRIDPDTEKLVSEGHEWW